MFMFVVAKNILKANVKFQMTLDGGHRQGSFNSFARNKTGDRSLTVLTYAQATRVLLEAFNGDHKRATGVRLLRFGQEEMEVFARKGRTYLSKKRANIQALPFKAKKRILWLASRGQREVCPK